MSMEVGCLDDKYQSKWLNKDFSAERKDRALAEASVGFLTRKGIDNGNTHSYTFSIDWRCQKCQM